MMEHTYQPITYINIILHVDKNITNELLIQLNILRSMHHVKVIAILNNNNTNQLIENNNNNKLFKEHIYNNILDFDSLYFGDYKNTVLICKFGSSSDIINLLKSKESNPNTTTSNDVLNNMAIIEYNDIESLKILIYGLQTCFRVNKSYNSSSYYNKLYKDNVLFACDTSLARNKDMRPIIDNIINNSYKPSNIRTLIINIGQTGSGIKSKIKYLFKKSKRKDKNLNYTSSNNNIIKLLVKQNIEYKSSNYNIIFNYNNIFGLIIIDFILFTNVNVPSINTIKRYTKQNTNYKYTKRGKSIDTISKTKRITNITVNPVSYNLNNTGSKTPLETTSSGQTSQVFKSQTIAVPNLHIPTSPRYNKNKSLIQKIISIIIEYKKIFLNKYDKLIHLYRRDELKNLKRRYDNIIKIKNIIKSNDNITYDNYIILLNSRYNTACALHELLYTYLNRYIKTHDKKHENKIKPLKVNQEYIKILKRCKFGNK